ncbi:ethylene-responsive transcription factor ERF020 [Cajanus cajan]|uniref:Ethylene-responsive transcription factor ERF020 family n=1 Tax=Cajanus cajan TaxID=3821 RepID=A0A151SCW2_CAJCA|nr:ethylene-responsive transcription factor ERF020 [Cajanus cajan]KYP52654.1 Ethylene-responsive transcription factor ERF020 family [Cajanus cajan]
MSWTSKMHATTRNKFKGVRRRKWGKWVSEIRVPGSQERLWLGTYATPEAAAVAHDVAVYYLRRPSSLDKLNFPDTFSSYRVQLRDMSPRSVQKVASDVAMDVDARNIVADKTSSMAVEDTFESQNKIVNGDDHFGAGADHCDVLWWDGFGNDESGTWQTSFQDCSEGENLSVSIQDYL